MARVLRLLPVLFLAAPLGAQSATPSMARPKPPAAITIIRERDIKRDLYALASDELRGREAGTIDEMRASMWLAEEMRKIGLVPKGDMGSWFQWWNMRRARISTTSSSVTLGGRTLTLWTDITPATNTAADVSAPTIFVSNVNDTTVAIRGKIAVVSLVAPAPAAIRSTTNTYEYNYTRPAITAMSTALTRRGAAGVIVVADSIADIAFDGVAKVQSRGTYDVIGGVPRFTRNPNPPGPAVTTPNAAAAPPPVPVLFARRSALADLRTDGQVVDIRLRTETFESRGHGHGSGCAVAI